MPKEMLGSQGTAHGDCYYYVWLNTPSIAPMYVMHSYL